ncbi:membrane-bound PQQ-dependent dehydrogenase, glucose/quinate/shikimate family [Novosphingobium lentum]|uniref:membrane-bound PQQ-dependent dehydrogenase, glucose/quinate/shikimate family n=1 Tax=Novosphingobium lentum TaxID=145287 RepID=UPI00082F2E7A|nr:membrane-bound PQQ-dependent dehydrogenase, glucose/quinate/shikimate family [Novosphingobium lentum]
MATPAQPSGASWSGRILGLSLLLIGAAIALGGAYLITLGGSAYYLAGGAATAAAGWFTRRARPMGGLLYGGFLLVTLLWSLWEAGFDGWQLMPRMIGPAVFGLAFVLPGIRRAMGRAAWLPAAVGAVMIAVTLATAIGPGPNDVAAVTLPMQHIATPGTDGEWAAFGRDAAGTRFSPLAQITPANVSRLQPAWTFHTGVVQGEMKSPLEATPIMVGGLLTLCTQTNVVIALDPETGKQVWRYDPKVDPTGASTVTTCRGVAHFSAPGARDCPERIITATFDARLIALDARTGQLCAGFGNGGTVDLKQGLGTVLPGFYYVSSAPTIVRGNIVLGGWVADNQSTDEPSGVIRAFDAVTGKFAWAWDAGNPANAKGPPPGQWYTRSTPNSWAPMSADEALGLVFVPTGNSTPDHFGAQRSAASLKYGSSVVALDAATGALKWSFQTTHNDLWDYDVPAQPTLFDATINGQQVPALAQATKRGELFLLDRRTGVPLTRVDELAVPQRGHVPEEKLSPTQPFSTGMPNFRGERLTERLMWGITPIDQLWCRIRFRQLRYDGPATPPGLDEALLYPSIGGGQNYGGVAIDPERGVMIVNTLYYGTIAQMVPRAETDRLHAHAKGMHDWSLPLPMKGTPYGIRLSGLLSPLDIPCHAPPFGTLHGIDLKTRKLLWSRPFGTTQDSGPLGFSLGLPLPMGMHNFGGAMTTRSGLTFIGSVKEHAFRAFDTATGKELWKARLPASANANPMTYTSPASGRQFVVVAAGGHVNLQSMPLSDTFVAYALPRSAK